MAALSSGQIDEPPVSNIGFIRVVRRPMSLSDFPSTPTSPRSLGYRHSMYATGRRPLRSSPLAGPALRVDELIEEVDEEKNQRSHLPGPSRVLSTPNMASLLTPPPQLRHARPKTVESAQEGFPHLSILSPLAKPPKCSLSPVAKGSNSEMVPSLQPPLSPFPSSLLGIQRRSVSSLSLRYYPTQGGNLRPPPAALQRSKSTHGYAIIQHPPTNTIREQQLEKECIIAPTPTRGPKDNSWFITNTYQVTPKFSRLGLAASGVVLPVSAKNYKRLSRHSPRSSSNPGASTTGVFHPMDCAPSSSSPSPVPSAPDISSNDVRQDGSGVTTPTLTISSASSLYSDESSIAPSEIFLTNSTPVVAASTDSATTIVTIMEGVESVEPKDRDGPQSRKSAAIISSKKNKLMRFGILKHHIAKSFNFIYRTSINQPSKDDCRESNEKRKGSQDGGTARCSNEIKLGLEKFSRTSSSEPSSNSSNKIDLERSRLFPLKKSPSTKKLLRLFAMDW